MRFAYKGEYLSVRSGRAMARGRELGYEEIVKPDIVVVLPFLKNDVIVLERNFRPVLGRFIYEIPAGYLDKGEKPVDAARRELAEETGYRARRMKLAFAAYEAPGMSRSLSYHFVAAGLSLGKRRLDDDEIIDVKSVKFGRALEMIDEGSIVDEKTIAFLEHCARHNCID